MESLINNGLSIPILQDVLNVGARFVIIRIAATLRWIVDKFIDPSNVRRLIFGDLHGIAWVEKCLLVVRIAIGPQFGFWESRWEHLLHDLP